MSEGKRRRGAVDQSNTSQATTPRQQQSEREIGVRRPDQKKVKRDKERAKLPLKSNGELVDVGHALAELDMLRGLQDVHPDQFNALIAVYEGRPNDVPAEHIALLKESGGKYYFGPEGLLPEITNLLASSLEIHDNSRVLVQPFKLNSAQQKILADHTENLNDSALLDLIFPSRRRRGGPPIRG